MPNRHCQQRNVPNRIAVLVVENDVKKREDFANNLRRWGYRPILAEGRGRALQDSARALVRLHRCRIALVDMRLLDDYSSDDTSGLELATDLRPAIPIIVSGYGDVATVAKALKKKGAFDFVDKADGPLRLRDAIAEALDNACACRLCVQWHPHYGPEEIVRGLRLDACDNLADELHCLIRQLYSQAEVVEVELKPVAEHYRQSDQVLPLERSSVLIAQARGSAGVWHQQEVIKLAPRDQIECEIYNYGKYVRNYLPAQRTARIEDKDDTALWWDIGAIRYTNIATESRRPLRQWYAGASVQSVVATIEDLFTRTLQRWYYESSPRAPGTIYDYYVATFPKLLGLRIEQAPDTGDTLTFQGLPGRLLDPVRWVRGHRDQSRFVSRWLAYTHGDLHSDNIFVDLHSQTCVIDYERSGPGYILRDFVELEADIRLRLLPLERDALPLALYLDLLLLAPDQPDQEPRWVRPPDVDEYTCVALHKAFMAICTLRRLAFQLTHFELIDEYYWALLMETLISALRQEPEWQDPAMSALAKDRALLAAALLCERLARWGRAWPPQEWRSPVEPGVPMPEAHMEQNYA